MSATEIYSPGLEGVIAGETAISTVADGLRYRGYPVPELANKTTFEEVAYLLLHGELPAGGQLAEFRRRLAGARRQPGALRDLLKALPPSTSPMDALRTAANFRRLAEELLIGVGAPTPQTFDTLGDWSDGVENSILVTLPGPVGPAAVRYASARFGLLANQKAVLVFTAAATGPDAVYQLDVPEPSTQELRKALDREGVQFRTLVARTGGHRVVILDTGRRLRSAVGRLAARYGVEMAETAGSGEFLGADTRDEARRAFRRVIESYDLLRQVRARTPAGAQRLRGPLLEALFPGVQVGLNEACVPLLDVSGDLAWFTSAGWAVRFPSGVGMLSASRDLLEWVVRRRVAACPAVRFLEGTDVVGLLPHVIGNGVAGARVRRRDRGGKDVREESLGADLVVDASGRGSRAPRWLEALGYPAPRETVVNSFLAYASRLYRRPGRLAANGKGLHLQGTPANGGRGGLALPVEGDRLIVTRTGRGEACPPTDEAGFLAFAGDLADPALYDVLRDAEPLSPVAGHRATENRVRHYERLARRPENFVVLGDAACAFNPVYGQGMTTAALAAVTLGEALRGQPRGDLTGLAGRFQRRLARVNATPWLLATAEDFSYPATEGERPGWWARRKQRHLGRVVRLSTRDLRARRELLEVLHLAKPFATLFRPRLLLAVLRQAWGRSPGGPGGAAEAMSGEVVPR